MYFEQSVNEKLQRVEDMQLNKVCHYFVFVHIVSINIWDDITLLLQMCCNMFL